MNRFFQKTSTFFICSIALLQAANESVGIIKEKQIPQTNTSAIAPNQKNSVGKTIAKVSDVDPNYKAFTAKVLGSNVRLRLQPDADSHIVKDLNKGELLVVMSEKNDFYAVEAPEEVKAYIFRSFVLDNVVEGNRVNVRLAPELNSPIIAFMNTGEKVQGSISDKNHKWLEIAVPKHVRFYVAKEYLEKLGGPELKALRDKKKDTIVQLLDSAELLSQSEMMKSFEEIDFEKISDRYNNIINEYSEFAEFTDKAKSKLASLQETYLQKKLAYLESRASKISRDMSSHSEIVRSSDTSESPLSLKDRTKVWEKLEESLFLSWTVSHHKKTIDDFYDDQKQEATQITGIVEAYSDAVRNKPGNYIIRDRDMPKAYLYSTFIDLQNYVGKYVTVSVSPRPNNNFAFPCYFVLSVEK